MMAWTRTNSTHKDDGAAVVVVVAADDGQQLMGDQGHLRNKERRRHANHE